MFVADCKQLMKFKLLKLANTFANQYSANPLLPLSITIGSDSV